ncbi:MAG: dTDP-glucose 4,6-dehydratase [Anaerolineales bacterium]|nr:dTDP-glucose 4,6-dehydratase [Anaerolineales bacterium]
MKSGNFRIRARYLIVVDVIGIAAAFLISFLIRYEAFSAITDKLVKGLPLLAFALALRIGLKLILGLYSQIWQHASVRELLRIVWVVSLGSVIIVLVNFAVFPFLGLSNVESRGVLVLDWILNIAYLGGSRLFLRILFNWLLKHNKSFINRLSKKQRVLIMGAGDVGATVLRLIYNYPELGLYPIGFTDDDPAKKNARLQGLSVLGNRNDIPKIVSERKVDEVIVAMPTAPQAAIDDVRRICAAIPVAARVIPSIFDLLSGTLTIDQLRHWRPLDGVVTTKTRSHDQEVVLPVIRNVLVTGGAGFISSNFVRYMLQTHSDCRVVVYDKLTYAGNLDNLLGLEETYGNRYVFVKGDICNYGDVAASMERYDIDAIVNFAAETHVDRSLMNPDSFLRTNFYGTYTLLEAAKNFDVVHYHQVSTDEVYGQAVRGTFYEQDPLETRSPYSASKAAGDLLVHSYYVSFGIPATITRGSNNIGPYQYPEKVVPLFVTNALDNQPIPVYGDGKYIRDYQYVIDHCRGIDHVLHYGNPGEIYNLGGGNEVEALDLAKMILDKLGKPHSLICLVEDRTGQDRRYSLNCAKIKSLGWTPEWTFERALDETIEWYVKNEGWWRKIKNGEYWEYYERQYRERLEQAVKLELSKE